MARTARGDYVATDKEAVYYIRCRTNRTLVLPAHHSLADAFNHRVQYIEDLIRLYARHFAISVHAHAVTRREIRLVLQSHPELISELDDAQIARRWLSICPTLRRGDDLSDEPSDEEIQALCDDPPRISQIRLQLCDISWLMRLLQQRVAQLCNREDRRVGRFWQSRFRAVLLLDAMSHLAALVNVDLAAVRVQMGKPISASTFTSDVYRRKELQSGGEERLGMVHSDGQIISNHPTAAQKQNLTSIPSGDSTTVASQPSDGVAGQLECPAAVPPLDCSESLQSTDTAKAECRDGRHLAPVFQCRESTVEVVRQSGWRSQFRCTEQSSLDIHLRIYRELVERTALGCQANDLKLSSLNTFEVLRKLQLTSHQWVTLVGEFDQLFSHVAGRLAAMDAFKPKRGGRRACVRPAARSLLRS